MQKILSRWSNWFSSEHNQYSNKMQKAVNADFKYFTACYVWKFYPQATTYNELSFMSRRHRGGSKVNSGPTRSFVQSFFYFIYLFLFFIFIFFFFFFGLIKNSIRFRCTYTSHHRTIQYFILGRIAQSIFSDTLWCNPNLLEYWSISAPWCSLP